MKSSNIKKETGHRERLRKRFLAGEAAALSDEALLELLLTYAIPQKDVRPLAKQLISRFGSLEKVFSADITALNSLSGIKEYSIVLLKLTDWLCHHRAASPMATSERQAPQYQLFKTPVGKGTEAADSSDKTMKPRKGTGLFGKAILKEAITLLPKLPDTQSLDLIKKFLKNSLHFSAEQTRKRNTDYIVQRMFPQGYADQALRYFALGYSGRQELKDVCFYRFCNAEPLMFDVIEALFLPAIGAGRLKRERIREYLKQRFPSSKSIGDSAKAIVDALVAGGVARADYVNVHFSYREILLPSFAFISHSEFPEPGMFDIAKLENNRALRAMLWNPTRILPSLYELRNQGIVSKISEIDNFRQFTTRWTLDEVIAKLPDGKGRS